MKKMKMIKKVFIVLILLLSFSLIACKKNEEVLLIDSWRDSEALDKHHASELMQKIAQLRDKYDLHMRVFKYEGITDNTDSKYIRK